MNSNDVIGLLQDQIAPMQERETSKAKKSDKLLRGGEDPYRVRRATDKEKATLRELSHTSLLSLIVQYSSQQLVVEGVSVDDDQDGESEARMWSPFEKNGMPSRQAALNTAVLTYGVAYGLALPGDEGAYMRGFSPKNFGALYGDVVDDEFPMWAYRVIPQGRNREHWRIYDEEFIYFVSKENGSFTFLEAREHGMGVCPVVRFTVSEDLEGNVLGDPERFQRDAARHDKTVYDRLLIQHYNSWRTKYARLLADDLTEEEKAEFRLKLAHDDILTGYGDTEFGTLDQTDLSPMKAAQEADRDLLAAVSQTPVWAFNGGSMVNLSADALIEAKSGNRQKVGEIQRGLNRAYCDWLRLAAFAEGRVEDSQRYDLSARWTDIGSQTLAAAADGLGKLATQLGVPPEMLWELIPGVPDKRIQAWRRYAETHPQGDAAVIQALARQAEPVG